MAEGKTEKEALSSIKTAVSQYWKPKYDAAVEAKDGGAVGKVKSAMEATGLYGNVDEYIKKYWQK